jgi:hypothetical protein
VTPQTRDSARLQWIDQERIKRPINNKEVIDRMRAAMIAYSAGECEMPIPMHAPQHSGREC